MLLRHYLAQGVSKSALARQLGIHRDTIHRWIRDGDLDRDLDATAVCYGPRPAVATKLDAYKGIIEARLAASAAVGGAVAGRDSCGGLFAGGYTQLKDFVRHVRPAVPPAPVIRFETAAGEDYGKRPVMVSCH